MKKQIYVIERAFNLLRLKLRNAGCPYDIAFHTSKFFLEKLLHAYYDRVLSFCILDLVQLSLKQRDHLFRKIMRYEYKKIKSQIQDYIDYKVWEAEIAYWDKYMEETRLEMMCQN